MGKKVWITPSEALAEMRRKLPLSEPIALAIWARDKALSAKARSASLYDGIGYVDLLDKKEKKKAWWEDVWFGITNPCTIPDRNRLNWTAAELVVFREIDDGIYEEITVKGVEFHRHELVRCIIQARDGKPPQSRASPEKVRKWVDMHAKEQGLENLRDRTLKADAKAAFPGKRGASTQAGNRLRELRTDAKTAQFAHDEI